MGINIETFLAIPDGCVFALVNKKDKLVYVNYSTEALGYLARMIKELRDGTHGSKKMTRDIKSLKIEILSETGDAETLKMHTLYWRDRYAAEGYSSYGEQKVPLQYVCKIRPSDDFKSINVVLVNRRHEVKIVGVFGSIGEAHEFKNACYNELVNKYCLPVYAANSRTREYLSSVSSKLRW